MTDPRRFFYRLTPQERGELLAIAHVRRFRDGQYLTRQGEAPANVALIRQGRAKVVASTSDGRRTILMVCGVGDLVGGSDYYAGGTCLASIVAAGPTEAAVVDRDALAGLLRRCPGIAQEIARGLNEQLVWANRRRIADSLPVTVRTAQVLLDLHHSATPDSPSDQSRPPIDVPFTQRELAELIGAAEVSVQKALRELADAGLVVRRYGRTSIPHPDRMQRFLDEACGIHPVR